MTLRDIKSRMWTPTHVRSDTQMPLSAPRGRVSHMPGPPVGGWQRHFLLCAMSDSEEVWKPVSGYEGKYSVSNQGRVRSETRTLVNENGVERLWTERILNPVQLSSGYRKVVLYDEEGRQTFKVATLVAYAFLGEPPGEVGRESADAYQVNHINADKWDDRAKNLEWCTLQENHTHAWENGLHPRGEERPDAKLTAEDVREARRVRKDTGKPFRDLAEDYGVSTGIIRRAVRGIYWDHIQDPPPIPVD